MLAEVVATWECDDVYVGCSGTLNCERVLAASGRFKRIHGNDVEVLPTAAGRAALREDWDLRVADEWRGEYGWLEDWLDGPVAKLATIQLASSMLQGHGKDNRFYDRMRAGYLDQWPRLHTETVERLSRPDVLPPLSSFFVGDVREYMEAIPAGFVSFPPFHYAKGYEAMFAAVNQVFDWDQPTYEPLPKGWASHLFDWLRERPWWTVTTDHLVEDAEDFLTAIIQPGWGSVPHYLYARTGNRRVVRPKDFTFDHGLGFRRLRAGERLGERLTLRPLPAAQFATLRAVYLNPMIQPAPPTFAAAVLVDDVMVGVLAGLTRGGKMNNLDHLLPGPNVYLMSDFPIAGTDYPKLSKLVAMAARTEEFQSLAEASGNHRFRSVTTTAFTQNPVSMKYRGALNLLSRKDAKKGSGFKYQLLYGATFDGTTLDDVYATWRAKSGETKAA